MVSGCRSEILRFAQNDRILLCRKLLSLARALTVLPPRSNGGNADKKLFWSTLGRCRIHSPHQPTLAKQFAPHTAQMKSTQNWLNARSNAGGNGINNSVHSCITRLA